MINIRAVVEKVDSIQEQMGNVSREMETLRRNQKEILEIKKLREIKIHLKAHQQTQHKCGKISVLEDRHFSK